MKTLTFRTIIEKDGKWYHGYVPTLSGCHTQGTTIEETRKNLREAIKGYLKTLIERREATIFFFENAIKKQFPFRYTKEEI